MRDNSRTAQRRQRNAAAFRRRIARQLRQERPSVVDTEGLAILDGLLAEMETPSQPVFIPTPQEMDFINGSWRA